MLLNKWACDRLTEDVEKKSSCQMKLILIIVEFGAPKTCTHTLKSTQNESLVWCEFYFKGIIGSFFFENEQGEAVTVNSDCYRAMLNDFCSQKLKRRILATFGFNRTALRATQLKLHSMFCALFLKTALSDAELMLFGHLGAAI